MRAPRPVLSELFQYRALVKNLVFKDLKLKYRDSALGVLWSLLNPLLLLVVYTLTFKYVLRVGIDNYAYFLLIGLLTWNFFANSVLASTRAIIGNADLIKKVYFPREALPIAVVLFNFAQFLLAMGVFLPSLIVVTGAPLGWPALLFVPLLALHLLFTVGLAFILSALTTLFRDVAHLSEVALLLAFWLTPIIYPVGMAPAALQLFFKASPLAAFAIGYQDVLFWGRLPEVPLIVTLVGWTAAVLVVGHSIFRLYSPAFAEEV